MKPSSEKIRPVENGLSHLITYTPQTSLRPRKRREEKWLARDWSVSVIGTDGGLSRWQFAKPASYPTLYI